MTFTLIEHPIHVRLNRCLLDTFGIASSESLPVLKIGIIVDMVNDGRGDALYTRHIISKNYIVQNINITDGIGQGNLV